MRKSIEISYYDQAFFEKFQSHFETDLVITVKVIFMDCADVTAKIVNTIENKRAKNGFI